VVEAWAAVGWGVSAVHPGWAGVADRDLVIDVVAAVIAVRRAIRTHIQSHLILPNRTATLPIDIHIVTLRTHTSMLLDLRKTATLGTSKHITLQTGRTLHTLPIQVIRPGRALLTYTLAEPRRLHTGALIQAITREDVMEAVGRAGVAAAFVAAAAHGAGLAFLGDGVEVVAGGVVEGFADAQAVFHCVGVQALAGQGCGGEVEHLG
jgi:hypothetical protein